MTSNKYESVRISPEAKKKLQQLCKDNGITMVKGLDRLLQIEGAFTNREIYQDEVDRVTQEPYFQESLAETSQAVIDIVRNTIPTKPTKPHSAIIDASILYSFKKLGKQTLTRKDIKDAVIMMMQESKYPMTWSRVYPRWWENYQRNKT